MGCTRCRVLARRYLHSAQRSIRRLLHNGGAGLSMFDMKVDALRGKQRVLGVVPGCEPECDQRDIRRSYLLCRRTLP